MFRGPRRLVALHPLPDQATQEKSLNRSQPSVDLVTSTSEVVEEVEMRRVPLVAAAIVIVAGCAQPAAPPRATAVGSSMKFSATSFWYQALGSHPTLDPNSAALVANFDAVAGAGVGINNDAYSIPIYTVPAGEPTVSLSNAPGCNTDPTLDQTMSAVPIPPGAKPANGTDMSLVIYQPSTDTDWEIWGARNNGGDWTRCYGGEITHVSQSDGVFQYPYGLSASGLSYLASAIKVSELAAGNIPHALAVNVPCGAPPVAPANRSDGGGAIAGGCIPEGTHFRLDPTLDLSTLGLTSGELTIAKALQEYGMYVTDQAGGTVLAGEDVVSAGSNPYPGLGLDVWPPLGGIPWNRLVAVAG